MRIKFFCKYKFFKIQVIFLMFLFQNSLLLAEFRPEIKKILESDLKKIKTLKKDKVAEIRKFISGRWAITKNIPAERDDLIVYFMQSDETRDLFIDFVEDQVFLPATIDFILLREIKINPKTKSETLELVPGQDLWQAILALSRNYIQKNGSKELKDYFEQVSDINQDIFDIYKCNNNKLTQIEKINCRLKILGKASKALNKMETDVKNLKTKNIFLNKFNSTKSLTLQIVKNLKFVVDKLTAQANLK